MFAALGAAAVLFTSNQIAARSYDVPAALAIEIPADEQSVTEGGRLVKLLGCGPECHGRTLEGGLVIGDGALLRLVTPGLGRAMREYSDAELVRVIRQGVRRDGRSVFLMPSEAYSRLADDDVGKLIAYLRLALPAAGEGRQAVIDFTVGGRLALLSGRLQPVAETIVHEALRPPQHRPSDPASLGEYLAASVCAECHGADLRGSARTVAPDLVMVSVYPPESLARLLRTGESIDKRRFDSTHVRITERLSTLTDEEISAIDAHLRARADIRRSSGS